MKQSEIDECQHQNMTADCVCQDCGYDRIIEPILERGRRQEQERIIKLLEQHEIDISLVQPTCYCGQAIYDIDHHRIELITGEQK